MKKKLLELTKELSNEQLRIILKDIKEREKKKATHK